MSISNDKIQRGLNVLVKDCADLKPDESVLIITNDSTIDIGNCVKKTAGEISKNVTCINISSAVIHGVEPPEDVAKKMLSSDVIFGLTKMSMAHTKARLNASEKGAKYLSLPDYSFEVLQSDAMSVNFKELTEISFQLAEILTDAEMIHIETEAGTDFACSAKNRRANYMPGWCYSKGTFASPPDAEVNVAPLEISGNGLLVVDGSIPCGEIGLLNEPVILTVEKGMVVDIKGEKASVLKNIFAKAGSDKSKVIAEVGIGLNPLARLTGSMLEDEGCMGTVHIGIGSNKTIGGMNDVPFHLDHIIKNVTLTVDDKIIIRKGIFSEEFRNK